MDGNIETPSTVLHTSTEFTRSPTSLFRTVPCSSGSLQTPMISVNLKNSITLAIKSQKKTSTVQKIPSKRVVTETSKWNFSNEDLIPEKQIAYIQHMKENVDEAQRIEVFRLNSVDGSRRSLYTERQDVNTSSNQHIYKFILQQLNQKIYGYRSQDLKKKKFDETLFINSTDVLKLMVECKNNCYYCKESVQILYANVREPKQWTLDRIDNAFGHNKTNVAIACLQCNLRRKTMYHERYVFTKQLNIVKTN